MRTSSLITTLLVSFLLAGPGSPPPAPAETPVRAQQLAEEGYVHDETLTGPRQQPEIRSTSPSPLSVRSREGQSNLQVETGTAITPYLGAARKQANAPSDMPHLLEKPGGTPLDRYHLETGVGVNLSDRTDLNLGYRFKDRPSLIDSPSGQTKDPAEDLRFSLDFKVPF